MKIWVITKKTGILLAIVIISVLALVLIGRGRAITVSNPQRDLPIYSVRLPENEKRVAISFDAAWGNEDTQQLIDILAKHNVKATFFVVGRQIAGREKILLREAGEGHAIGIHTYTHEYNKIYASADALRKDIDLCSKAIRSVLPDFNTDLYRFPGGSYNVKKELVQVVEKAGYRHYDWNCSAEDAVSPNTPASVLYQNVLDSAGSKNEVILLMHDGVGYKETIKCLPSVIKHFREKGFAFCTL